LLQELTKKERQLGIYPDPEVDLFMKVRARASVSTEGSSNTVVVYLAADD
jgi:hypothetical protein